MGSAVFTSWRAASRLAHQLALAVCRMGMTRVSKACATLLQYKIRIGGGGKSRLVYDAQHNETSSARVGSATRAPSRSEQRTACATRKEGSTSALHTSRHAGNETEAHSSPSWRPMVWPCGSGGGLTDAEAVTRSTNKVARRIGTETGAPVDSPSSQSPHRFGRARTCDRPGHTVTVVGTLEAAERFRPAHVPRGHSQP